MGGGLGPPGTQVLGPVDTPAGWPSMMMMMMATRRRSGIIMMIMMMVAMTKTDVSRRVVLYYSSVLKLKPYSTFPATRGTLKLPARKHLSPIRILRGRCWPWPGQNLTLQAACSGRNLSPIRNGERLNQTRANLRVDIARIKKSRSYTIPILDNLT